MGGGSSKSSTSNYSNQVDKRIGVADNAVVLQAEGGSTINMTDGGLVDAAKTMFASGLDFTSEGLKQFITSLDSINKRSLDAANTAQAAAYSAVSSAQSEAYKAADLMRQQADEQNYKATIKWVAAVSIIALIAWGYRK